MCESLISIHAPLTVRPIYAFLEDLQTSVSSNFTKRMQMTLQLLGQCLCERADDVIAAWSVFVVFIYSSISLSVSYTHLTLPTILLV